MATKGQQYPERKEFASERHESESRNIIIFSRIGIPIRTFEKDAFKIRRNDCGIGRQLDQA
jgi:hypothetical protein